MSYLAIDLGATWLRVGWFSGNGTDLHLIQRDETLTHVDQPVEAVMSRVIALARRVVPPDESPTAVGIAAPGLLNPHTGSIIQSDNLPGWWQVPVVAQIRAAFDDAPTFMNNDANLAALAEAYLGAARGADPVLYLTIGTGIGGGAVLDGKLYTGQGMALEPGHMLFRQQDGTVKNLEQLASGAALARIASDQLTKKRTRTVLRKSDPLDGQAVGLAALNGDKFARQLVDDAVGWLALGVSNLIYVFHPQVIILGGGVTALGEALLGPLRDQVAALMFADGFFYPGMIRLAQLGPDVCLHGAAHYARTRAKWDD